MKKFVSEHKKLSITIGVLIGLVILIGGGINQRKAEQARLEQDRLEMETDSSIDEDDSISEDDILMSSQEDLESTYGKAPDGFIYDYDGTLISLGDKDMTAEEVVYAYFRGLSSLDISTVERYSRGSKVVASYSEYFDSSNTDKDYMDQFMRDLYKESLLSLQVVGIDNQTVFAGYKKSFTVRVKMLDLTDKDFWVKDKEKIYDTLYLYSSSENDSTKSEIYLYDYISSYYKSDKAKLREVTFDITLEKFADLDSGWLVSIDTDVDSACSYKDGKLVVSYIREKFQDEGLEVRIEGTKSDSKEEVE